MSLERQSIEKKDFPIGRRGYDPGAVDAHLQVLADEIEQLKRASRRRSETLASSASEQVRAIVEAAETSAAEIQQQAEEEAHEIRAEAGSEAKATREQAVTQARDYVGKVSESTAVMLQRLDAMENELGALLEALRTGASRLNADLQLLEGNLNEVGGAVGPQPAFHPEPSGPSSATTATPAPQEPGSPSPVGAQAAAPSSPSPSAATGEEAGSKDGQADHQAGARIEHADPGAAGSSAGTRAAGSDAAADDDEGARLIALNMALNGTPRDETERYLADNFQLQNRRGLLDEVYASVES